MTAIQLYSHPLSGHAHRVRLFLSLLGIEYERIDVDLARGAHKQPEFLRINPFGQVPVHPPRPAARRGLQEPQRLRDHLPELGAPALG